MSVTNPAADEDGYVPVGREESRVDPRLRRAVRGQPDARSGDIRVTPSVNARPGVIVLTGEVSLTWAFGLSREFKCAGVTVHDGETIVHVEYK